MPSQPKDGRQHRSVTFVDADWYAGKPATEHLGTSRNKIIEELWAWWLRRPGAKLPERPPLDVIERAYRQWEEREEAIRRVAVTIPCPVCKVTDGPCVTSKTKRPTETLHRPRLVKATEIVDESDKG